MKKIKKADEKNSLEQLLLRWKKSFQENKAKSVQYVLVVALVVVVVALFRFNVFNGSDKWAAADGAYYSATQNAFAGAGLPDAETLASVANAYKSSNLGASMHADAGSAYLLAGLNDVAGAKARSRGVKSQDENQTFDPKAKFQAAVDEFSLASTTNNPDVQARAYYGGAVAWESKASVAAVDAEVEASLQSAKELYQKIVDMTSATPYAALAKERLVSLERPLTLDYYKAIAKNFVELPEPADAESILPEGAKPGEGDLNADEAVSVENFETEDDAVEDSAVEEGATEEKTEETTVEATDAAK